MISILFQDWFTGGTKTILKEGHHIEWTSKHEIHFQCNFKNIAYTQINDLIQPKTIKK